MARMPKIVTKTNTSPEVLNAIRNSASQDYQSHVPIATPDADSVRKIGAIIMDYPAIQNEFIRALINRIAFVRVTSKTYQNPYSMFKKGIFENGETIEEVFVDLVRPYQYDPNTTDTEKALFRKYESNVRSAFHIMNYQAYYPVTIGRNELAQAFLTWEGVDDLISKQVNAIYTSVAYDEQNVMLYMLADHLLTGQIYPVHVGELSAENKENVAGTFRGMSNLLTFMDTKYNRAGVHTYTPREDQYIFMSSMYNGMFDASVLASAFNMDRANFFGHLVLVPTFGSIDFDRLDFLFEGDPNYRHFNAGELSQLDHIAAVIMDSDWWQVYDNLVEMREQEIPNLLRWNYFYHNWKTYGVSPFANAIVFTSDTPSVTKIALSPASIELDEGNSVQFIPAVTATGFARQQVKWSVSSGDASKVDLSDTGYVTMKTGSNPGTYKIKATSVENPSISGEATITVPISRE